jgi:hypothetical protein
MTAPRRESEKTSPISDGLKAAVTSAFQRRQIKCVSEVTINYTLFQLYLNLQAKIRALRIALEARLKNFCQ